MSTAHSAEIVEAFDPVDYVEKRGGAGLKELPETGAWNPGSTASLCHALMGIAKVEA